METLVPKVTLICADGDGDVDGGQPGSELTAIDLHSYETPWGFMRLTGWRHVWKQQQQALGLPIMLNMEAQSQVNLIS